MAAIDSAILSVQLVSSGQQANVVVNVQVSFGPTESALQARVDCRILGDDLLRDDFLFAYPTQFLFSTSQSQSVRFERENVSRSFLNEDVIGADEIVGEVTLRPLGGTPVVKRTNVFQIRD